MTHQAPYVRYPLEFLKEGRLEFPIRVIISFERLEDLIEPFEKERPEIV